MKIKALFITLILFSLFLKADQKVYKILVFQSFHETLPWTNQFLKGINNFKNSTKQNV